MTLLAAAACAAIPLTPAAAEPITGPIARPVALDGWIVYSYQADDNVWQLRGRNRAGENVTFPVAPSPVPFDVDLGTDREGNIVAVYSRCTPACRIVRLNVGSGGEQAIPGVHAAGSSETSPTLKGEVLGFQRRPAGRRSGGAYRLVTLGALRASRIVKRLRGDQTVTGADLTYRGLAISTVGTAGGSRAVSVQVKPSDSPWRTLQAVSSTSPSWVDVTAPAWRGNELLWGFTRRFGAATKLLVRARVTAAGVTYSTADAPVSRQGPATIAGVAVDANSTRSPLWILLEQPSEESPYITLDGYPVADLGFGAPRPGIGLSASVSG